MGKIIALAGGIPADLTWHGTERRRRRRPATAPEEYAVAVLTPREFEALVEALRRA
jgi:hypothetical protein